MYIHSFIHSYIQGLCHYNSCNEKAKIKTTDDQSNTISYYSRCQKHHDQEKALRKDCQARVSYRFYMHILLVIKKYIINTTTTTTNVSCRCIYIYIEHLLV